jgi:hypothetical protein
MGGLDEAEGITGYDEVDESQIFHGGNIPQGKSMGRSMGKSSSGGEGRKRGKKTLSSSSTYRTRSKRPMGGFSFLKGFKGFSFSMRGFEDTARQMLIVSIGAMVLCGAILYFTVGKSSPINFYGPLAASIVVMALLFFTASKLIGNNS